MHMELLNNSLAYDVWVPLCAEVLESLTYLHKEVNILHNDIKLNNVLIAISTDCPQYQAVLIDLKKRHLQMKVNATNLVQLKRLSIFVDFHIYHLRLLKG